jgi:hypothetical protein
MWPTTTSGASEFQPWKNSSELPVQDGHVCLRRIERRVGSAPRAPCSCGQRPTANGRRSAPDYIRSEDRIRILEKYGLTNSPQARLAGDSIPGRQALHFRRRRSQRHCHQALAVLFERDFRIASKPSGIRIDRLKEDPDLELGLFIDRSIERFRLHLVSPNAKNRWSPERRRLGGCW